MIKNCTHQFQLFSQLLPNFSCLPFQDQKSLLQVGTFEMCLLRGAFVFDKVKRCWPNTNMQMYKNSTQTIVSLNEIATLFPVEVIEKYIHFVDTIQEMDMDEPSVMILTVIILFTPERDGLVRKTAIEKFQLYYTMMLERYMKWRFCGKSSSMFGKLLTQLSNLRELGESVNNFWNSNLGILLSPLRNSSL